MKIEDLPQDKSALENITRELCYAKDSSGKYSSGLSSGWVVKADALDNAWNDINEKITEAKELVLSGKVSPIYYYMVKNIMNIALLSQHTGYWKFSTKRHLNSRIFNSLSNEKLVKYATVFNVTIEELKNPFL